MTKPGRLPRRSSLAHALLPDRAEPALRARQPDMPTEDIRRPIRELECPPGEEYDEDTFNYLLGMERARAERASRRVRLLLATLEGESGESAMITSSCAARLFGGLRQLLRDTDIVGWYRQNRVAGAVLCARLDGSDEETSRAIGARVGEGLRRLLPARTARNLRVRVTQQGPRRVPKG